MEQRISTRLNELIERYPALEAVKADIAAAYHSLAESFAGGGRLYICGNGGSAADALHIVGELMKQFVKPRKPDAGFAASLRELFPDEAERLISNLQGALPAFAVVESAALSTAFANDEDPSYVFAQQIYGYARSGDAVLGISTSGNSKNVLSAMMTAKARGAKTIGLTGCGGGKMRALCNVCICAPESETFKIQELHLPIYHALCLMLEERFWGES